MVLVSSTTVPYLLDPLVYATYFSVSSVIPIIRQPAKQTINMLGLSETNHISYLGGTTSSSLNFGCLVNSRYGNPARHDSRSSVELLMSCLQSCTGHVVTEIECEAGQNQRLALYLYSVLATAPNVTLICRYYRG
jgi:hypothetical protein